MSLIPGHSTILHLSMVLISIATAVEGAFVTSSCFSLPITDCQKKFDVNEITCITDHNKTFRTATVNIFCGEANRIEILNVTYRMPASAREVCSAKDKKLSCIGDASCYCCTKPEQLCSVTVAESAVFESCDNTTGDCSTTLPAHQFTQNECPSYKTTIESLNLEISCVTKPMQCVSRWVDVEYMCLANEDAIFSDAASSGTAIIIVVCVLVALVILLIVVVIVVRKIRQNRKYNSLRRNDHRTPTRDRTSNNNVSMVENDYYSGGDYDESNIKRSSDNNIEMEDNVYYAGDDVVGDNQHMLHQQEDEDTYYDGTELKQPLSQPVGTATSQVAPPPKPPRVPQTQQPEENSQSQDSSTITNEPYYTPVVKQPKKK